MRLSWRLWASGPQEAPMADNSSGHRNTNNARSRAKHDRMKKTDAYKRRAQDQRRRGRGTV